MQQLIFTFLFLFSLTIKSQNIPFVASEKLTFTASYNMSGLLTDLAQVTMETSEVKTSKSTILRLKCTATTYSKWDNFFKIRDLYESYVNPNTLTPYLYKRDIYEGGYTKFVQYKYNHDSKTIASLIRKKKREGGTYDKKKTLSISENTKDIVTTIYHLRRLNLSKASPGASYTFTVLFDNKETIVNFIFEGKEDINTAIGIKECYKLSIEIDGSNVLKGTNSNLLWLTADANKIPVYAKFKIPVGNGELKIKSASGLKY